MQESAQDPASLERLNDIVVPAATAWWPPAPGWYVLGALLLLAGVVLLVVAMRRWWKNRYRTAALHELKALRESLGQSTSAKPGQVVAEINRILKRTALAGWPRDSVASLSGESWIQFLNQAGPAQVFSAEQARVMLNVAWSSTISQQMTPSQLDSLFDLAAAWIRQHQTPDHELTPATEKAEIS
ncbi:MAG: DUF4381 domain-containing protein [Pirellulaceae bacterium]